MLKVSSALFDDSLKERFIICKYIEDENKEVKLIRLGYSNTEEGAKELIAKVHLERGFSDRVVIMKELCYPNEGF